MKKQLPPRSSIRSRGSSSTTASDPKEKVKDCCRKFVAFMCTQVGVGGLVVGYAVIGAFGFRSIEITREDTQFDRVRSLISESAHELWDLTVIENVDERTWRLKSDKVLYNLQTNLTEEIKNGYVGRPLEEIWSLPAALMFCLSIFTMIGYGNITPKTALGKGVTVLYAVFGIPLYVLYFMNMGKILASVFKWGYTKIYECSVQKKYVDTESNLPPQPVPRVIVPSTACLWVIAGYILTGTIMFAEWEKWGYLDSVYFCVTSLCKIGMGDFVPGQNISESKEGNQTKLVINFIYILLGMGLVAMCYNLMREEVRVKMRELKEDFQHCIDDLNRQSARCSGRGRS